MPRLSPTAWTGVAAFSLAFFVITLAAVPWILTRLPSDYLVDDRPLFQRLRPSWRFALRVGRNLGGFALLIAGIAMLVLPGQGVLTMLVGLMLMDFPRKRALERRLVSIPVIFRAINALRRRAGKEPLRLE